jgi:hypothetical protein
MAWYQNITAPPPYARRRAEISRAAQAIRRE